MSTITFLKLGGSLITDKTGVEKTRPSVISRLVEEIYRARKAKPDMNLMLGHGSGSFGHVHGAQHGTRQGVYTPAQWHGFAQVADAASRLNKIVVDALLAAGIPTVSLPPSASAICADGRIEQLAVRPVQMALAAGLLPVVFGDVAFDTLRGGTIISTEEVMMYMAQSLQPAWLLLSGETPGVLDLEGQVVPLITEENFAEVVPALGGSRGTDVTGGMATKVQSMLNLVADQPNLQIRIFSGLEAGQLSEVLLQPQAAVGTLIRRQRP